MKSEKLLESFTAYCKAYPEERFWQALRNWACVGFIWVSGIQVGEMEKPTEQMKDTFYWEGKNK